MTRHRHSSLGRDRAKTAKNIKRDLSRIPLLLDEWNDAEDGVLLELLRKRQGITESRQQGANQRKFLQRTSWEKFQRRLTDKQFCQYFRMERGCFDYLCERIIENVGERDFKSEEYLYDLQRGYISEEYCKQYGAMKAHEHSTGGFVSGQVKLALTLRLLAGGSYGFGSTF